MLFVFYGKKEDEVRRAALRKAHDLSNDQTIIHIGKDEYYQGVFLEVANSIQMFLSTQIFVVDTTKCDEVCIEELHDALSELAQSVNQFVVIEGQLNVSDKKIYDAEAEMLEEIHSTEEKKYDVFAISDALTRRDKKELWMRLVDMQQAGIPNEEIVGILLWQLKSMRLVSLTTSSEEAGLKPFVYDKAKRGCVKYKKSELRKLSFELVSLYHDGHTGKRDLSLSLEAWALKI